MNAEQYRQLAEKAREQAAASTLPQVKRRHLLSADHFDDLAGKLESTAQTKARNEAARAEMFP